jgi:flagellin
MDVDYASETANMTSKQMLLQAGTAMLKQSGSMSQLTLSLLQ